MRYFFHLADSDRDTAAESRDLPDDATAKAEAVRFAGELLQQDPHALWERGQRRVEVIDEHGALRWLVISMAIDAPSADEALDPRGFGSLGNR